MGAAAFQQHPITWLSLDSIYGKTSFLLLCESKYCSLLLTGHILLIGMVNEEMEAVLMTISTHYDAHSQGKSKNVDRCIDRNNKVILLLWAATTFVKLMGLKSPFKTRGTMRWPL